jgi:hypothetical protein
MSNSDLLTALPQLLRWQDTEATDDLIANLAAAHYQRAADGLGMALHALSRDNRHVYETLRGRLRDLPDPIYLRLLGAPHTWFLVAGYESEQPSPKDIAAYLTDALDAEDLKAGRPAILDHGIWSCLGNDYFPVQNSGDAQGLIWNPESPFVAPSLPGEIPIDFWSPLARGPLPEIPGTDIDMTESAITTTVDKLRQGLQAISQLCPTAMQVLICFCKVIVARQDPTTTEHRAASSPTTIGRPVLRNPQSEAATITELMDSLVHETIHAVIDIANLDQPIFIDRSVLPSRRGESPWTGRSLDLYTYIHACLVWYGLWHFWAKILGQSPFPDPVVLSYMQTAAKGFLSEELLTPLLPVREAIAPSLINLIDAMQETIQNAWAPLSPTPSPIAVLKDG